MFVREKVVPVGETRHTYVQIVESQRVGEQVKQRVVCSLGNRESLDPVAIDRLVMGLAKYGSVIPVPKPASASSHGDVDLGIGARGDRHFGDLFVLDQVWRDLGLRDILRRFAEERRFKFDLERAVFAVTVYRAPRRRRLGTIEAERRSASSSMPKAVGATSESFAAARKARRRRRTTDGAAPASN
jgi:hypothetical protein